MLRRDWHENLCLAGGVALTASATAVFYAKARSTTCGFNRPRAMRAVAGRGRIHLVSTAGNQRHAQPRDAPRLAQLGPEFTDGEISRFPGNSPRRVRIHSGRRSPLRSRRH